MSCTTIYVADENGDVLPHWEFSNSHGSAMAVWMLLGAKYDSSPRPSWDRSGQEDYWSPFAPGAVDRLFKMVKPPSRMQRWERIVMLTTADNVFVPIEHVGEVAAAMETFCEHFKAKRAGMVFSIGDQAACLRKILQEGTWRGVCWQQTSLSGCLWEGSLGSEDECVPYNIVTGTQHWSLFDDLKDEAV